MSISKSIKAMIYRYGESIKVVKGKSVLRARAIIQPLMYKNKMYLNGSALPAGTFDGGHYQMIAPADVDFGDFKGVIIEGAKNKYTLKRVEVVRADDSDLYIWAVLTPYYPFAQEDYGETKQCA